MSCNSQTMPCRSELNYQRHVTPLASGLPCYHLPQDFPGIYDNFSELGYAIGDLVFLPKIQPNFLEYLFNIFDDKEDPRQFNAPSDFKPVSRPHIQEQNEYFKPDTWLLSRNMKRVNPDHPLGLHSFACTSGSGAMLGLPEGALRKDMELSSDALKAYVRKHANKWYINAIKSNDLHNGSLILITGLDTTRQYYAASLIPETTSQTIGFTLLPGKNVLSYDNIPWHLNGRMTSKMTITVTSAYAPQYNHFTKPLFIRGFSIALNIDEFREILDADDDERGVEVGSIPTNPSSQSLSYRIASCVTKYFQPSNVIWIPPLLVYRPSLDVDLPYHLSNVILQRLIPHIPKDCIAIVHDDDWWHVIEKMDKDVVDRLVAGDWNEFADVILQKYYVILEHNIISLKLRKSYEMRRGIFLGEYLAVKLLELSYGGSNVSFTICGIVISLLCVLLSCFL